jgi:hypothetical protein
MKPPPPGMPARVLQARLIDAPDRIVDAAARRPGVVHPPARW